MPTPTLPVPALAAAQTLLFLGTDASPSVFTAHFSRIGDVNGPSTSVAVVDVSNQESVARRKLATLLDSGMVTFNLYWEPESVQDQALFAVYQTAPPVLRSYKIQWPDGQVWLFAGYLTKFAPASKIAGALVSACEIVIDNQILVVA